MSGALLIDAGNSRLKWRRWTPDAGLGPEDSCRHRDGRPDLDALAPPLDDAALERVHVACVAAPAITVGLREQLAAGAIPVDWLTTPARGLGLTNSYAQPHKLGIDRWLALAAEYAATGEASCVIDIGTAITVDVCDAAGLHQGGLIAPGPVALSQALSSHTALPAASEQWPDLLHLARDTEDALLCGALHAACGVIERGWQLAEELHGCRRATLTGGGARPLSPYLELPHRIDAALVFKGLALRAREWDNQQAPL